VGGQVVLVEIEVSKDLLGFFAEDDFADISCLVDETGGVTASETVTICGEEGEAVYFGDDNGDVLFEFTVGSGASSPDEKFVAGLK